MSLHQHINLTQSSLSIREDDRTAQKDGRQVPPSLCPPLPRSQRNAPSVLILSWEGGQARKQEQGTPPLTPKLDFTHLEKGYIASGETSICHF